MYSVYCIVCILLCKDKRTKGKNISWKNLQSVVLHLRDVYVLVSGLVILTSRAREKRRGSWIPESIGLWYWLMERDGRSYMPTWPPLSSFLTLKRLTLPSLQTWNSSTSSLAFQTTQVCRILILSRACQFFLSKTSKHVGWCFYCVFRCTDQPQNFSEL